MYNSRESNIEKSRSTPSPEGAGVHRGSDPKIDKFWELKLGVFLKIRRDF